MKMIILAIIIQIQMKMHLILGKYWKKFIEYQDNI